MLADCCSLVAGELVGMVAWDADITVANNADFKIADCISEWTEL